VNLRLLLVTHGCFVQLRLDDHRDVAGVGDGAGAGEFLVLFNFIVDVAGESPE